MSGGHYDYLCFTVSEFADRIEPHDDPRRIAFIKAMRSAADVCYAIEWEDSGDTSKTDTDKAIDEFFTFVQSISQKQ